MIDEEEYYIGASIDNLADKDDEFKKNDPFNKNWDFIKNLNNLDQNFKSLSCLFFKIRFNFIFIKHHFKYR